MTPLPAHRGRADRTFERLYRRHAGDVYRYALAVLHNQADAEDVTQTTFLNAYRALERGERPRAAHNWLIAIAHNVCRQRFRQSARRPNEVAWDDDVADRLVEDDDGAPTADDVRRALSHLAFNQRAALVMRELEGRSYAEIAAVLELSVSAVETLIFRARRALREQLEEGISCGEAELAISKQLDGRLSRQERSALRAHLRECETCATFARRQRAQRTALRSLGGVPLPASLASLFGGGGATVGAGVAAKAVAVVAAVALAGSAGYEGVHHGLRSVPSHATRTAAAHAPSRPQSAAPELSAAPAPTTASMPARVHAAPAPSHVHHSSQRPAHVSRAPSVPAEAAGHGGRALGTQHAASHTSAAAVSHGRGNAYGRSRRHAASSSQPTRPAYRSYGRNPHGSAPTQQPPGRSGGQGNGHANGNGNAGGNGNGHADSHGRGQPAVTVTVPAVLPTVTVPESPLGQHGKSGK